MATIPKITHKRGDTFSFAGGLQLTQGMTWAARSNLRAQGAVDAALPAAQSLTVTLTKMTAPQVAAAGLTLNDGMDGYMILIYAPPANTIQWPAIENAATPLQCDIEFYVPLDTTVVVSTETFIINVVIDPTHS